MTERIKPRSAGPLRTRMWHGGGGFMADFDYRNEINQKSNGRRFEFSEHCPGCIKKCKNITFLDQFKIGSQS